jgi:hypothetical protein
MLKKILPLFLPFFCLAQTEDSSKIKTVKPDVSAYLEMYFHYDLDDPGGIVQQPCFVSYAEKNGINANLALLQIKKDDEQTRGHLGIMTGNYAQYNLAAEPDLLRHIYEASLGVKIKKFAWLDVGVFPAHIGCESAIGSQNFNLTRSLIAENSPYFETGARLSYDRGKKWSFALLLLNGWQNIRETNKGKALGTLVTFKPSSSFTINSCGFAGNEKPDTAKQYRLFHDLNITWTKNERFSMILAADVGIQQRESGKSGAQNFDAWHGGSLQFRWSPWKKVSVGLRFEEYWDENKIIIAPTAIGANGELIGFSARGGSVNLDYKVKGNVHWRTEFKYLESDNEQFLNSDLKKSKTEIQALSALMIAF